ncbi:PREDICTED: uncharacterized protein T16H12.9-like [Branchiostoma belcheri]|uniref:Uncharacterized protein T16H12.9-like n=1 Tax=Branchiostoma belcheri TaxID=7741 RepID=A0A6P4XPB7_BRABE|nr:PREDICTED: uncharacterized protein T16H12.9-like [Branchiostoma belcheri]
MQLLVLCVTALLFGTVTAAPGQQHKSLLELLKKDARELAELVEYHENSLKNEAENDENLAGVEQTGEVEETKRQIGNSYPLNSCTEGTNGMVPLCQECFFIRQLPPEYFPSMLNERKCQAQKCLNNFGVCDQQYMTVKVLRNTGNDYQPRWEQHNIQVPSGCKCTLSQNGPLHPFIP